MGTQQTSFQDRLNRLSKTPTPVAPVVQPRAVKASGKSTRARPAKANAAGISHWTENIRYPLSFVRAFMIGVLAVFLARYVRYHLAGGSLTGDDADITMMIDGSVSVAVGFAIRQAFRISSKEFAPAQAAGVVAMVLLMHNMVHAFPKPMATIFSPQWVQEVVYYTEPKSILFRGVTFSMGGSPASTGNSQAMPGRIILDSEVGD